jgi:hypothetical protein
MHKILRACLPHLLKLSGVDAVVAAACFARDADNVIVCNQSLYSNPGYFSGTFEIG